MNKIYLTEVQIRAMLYLYEQPLTQIAMTVAVSRTNRTLDSLCEKGLVKWLPYGCGGEGCWKITETGKKFVESNLAEHLISNE